MRVVIPGALAQAAFVIRQFPCFAAIARAEYSAFFGFDYRVKIARVGGGHCYADDAHCALRKPFVARNVCPCVSAIGRLPQSRAGTAAFQAVWSSAHTPCACIKDAGIRRIQDQIHSSGIFVCKQNPLPIFATIARAIYSSHFIGGKEVTECRRIHNVGITRMNSDSGDLPRVA